MKKEKFLKILKNAVSVIVIIAMFIIIFYQNRDRDIFKFGERESDKLNSHKSSSISGFTSGSIKMMDENTVAFLTSTSYGAYNKDGEAKSKDVAFSKPTLYTKGSYAVCYEPGSNRVYVFDGGTEVYNMESENKIFLAKINQNGYLFLATEKSGYNCECVVYNHSGEAIFKWDISKSELIDGDINSDNDAIILSLASSEGSKMIGEVVHIDITNAEILKRNSYDSTIFFSVNFNENKTYVALGNKSLKYYNTDGTEKWSYDFKGKKLLSADITNHKIMALAFSGSGEMYDGNFTEVKAINKLGQVTGEKTFDGIISDVTTGSDCVAVALDKKVYVFDNEFDEKKQIKTDYGVKQIAMFSDDEHVFVLGSSSGEILK